MADDHLQRRADVLAERVGALAEALRAGGVPEERSAQLLSQASAAALQALSLELLCELRLRDLSVPNLTCIKAAA
jgi:hypothetical protein